MCDARSALLALALCLVTTASLDGQTFHGGVRGSVRDAAGTVAGAAIELIDDGASITATTTSNDRGEYMFADVLPAIYRVRVTAPGYKTSERAPLAVRAQAFLTVDFTLTVGDVAEVVTVRAAPPLADGASVSTLVDGRALDTQPSAGRNVFFTATATPTVVPTGDSQFVRQQDQSNSSLISIGGGPRRDNSYVLDGVPIVDILNRATFIPSFQAVEEMRVQVSAYDADIGRTSGGVFNAVSRSGSNRWQARGTFEERPRGAQSRLFFAEKSDLPPADSYFHLYGGAFGGPVVRNRTFFWASTEGYRSSTTRNAVLVLPTEAERRGDFSRSNVTIFDPLTTRRDPVDPSRFVRDPFPNNRIPPGRLNPVALALLRYVPAATSGRSRPSSADIVDAADQATIKATHVLGARATMSALYAWYGSAEPDARFFGAPLFENPADPGEGALVRRTHLFALNTQSKPRDRLLVQIRYGFNRFLDDNRPGAFDPSALGFDPGFLRQVQLPKFPEIGMAGYGRGGAFLGDRDQGTATYYAHQATATVSRLVGRHDVRAGSEYRITGVRFLNHGGTGGYAFSRDFTLGPNPNAPAAATGDAFASFLLGYPASGGISIASPIDVYLNYWSGFAQDQIRLTPQLTIDAGMRYEFEGGLGERHDRAAVGWAFDAPFPVQVGGTRPDGAPLALAGGLVFAGVDGAATRQGDPRRTQFAPRASFVYAIDERTILRGGYGLFWAPMQGISADELGSGTPGFSRTTGYVATGGNPFVPCDACTLTNPFPNGINQPRGSSLGRLTGVGDTIAFVDPRSHLAHLHRYSIELQRELPARIAAGVAYVGAAGVDLAGGSSGAPLNINQLDPKDFALGTALQEPVPNPFAGSELGLGMLGGATVPRGQLLRPYPQFDAVLETRAGLARSRYDAVVLRAERRLGRRWSARADYTWSRLTDSQWSESNFFAGGSATLDNFDVDHEYGLSVVDTPHRVNAAATIDLPFGIMISAVAGYQSGFPVTVLQSPNNSGLFGSSQRPNVVSGVNPQLADDPQDSYDPQCACIRWLNAAAWSPAAPFTFGDAPRTDGRVRTPARRTLDLAIEKSQRVNGASLGVRAEIINVFNRADFRGPNIAYGDATFGQIREAAGYPRMLQLQLRAAW